MDKMDKSKSDLNLLTIFEALFSMQNVSRAAEKLGVSQSTMSYELARLRKLFNDPLFVRINNTMRPTPRALQLIGPIRNVLNTIASDILCQKDFSPASASRTFTVCMSDSAELAWAPEILKFLSSEAPNIGLRTVSLDQVTLEHAMYSGDVDLAIGHYPKLKKAGFYQQRIVQSPFVGLVRASHPKIGLSPTLRELLSESHIVVAPEGRSDKLVEKLLERKGHRRRVILTTPYIASVPLVIAGSDAIGIVTSGVARTFSKIAGLRTISLPFRIPKIDVKQHWHERFHTDMANKWFRKKISEVFANRQFD